MTITDTQAGWLAVAGAVFCFGTFGVFIKTAAVREAKVDPFVFQAYKSLVCAATSFVPALYTHFEFNAWALLSASFWIPGGVTAVIAVTSIGLGVAQGLWSGLQIITGFVWGVGVFGEHMYSPALSIVGIIFLFIGVIFMALSRELRLPVLHERDTTATATATATATTAASSGGDHNATTINDGGVAVGVDAGVDDDDGVDDNERKSLLDHKDHSNATAQPSTTTRRVLMDDFVQRRVVGYIAAVITGTWGGSVTAPLKFSSSSAPPSPSPSSSMPSPSPSSTKKTSEGIEFVVSFGIGVAVVQLAVFAVYVAVRFAVLRVAQHNPYGESVVPPLHLRVMWRPGLAAGLLWSAGNYCSLYAVLFLGEAVGFPASQLSLMVAGVWSLLWYNEMPLLSQRWFWILAALLSLAGVYLLSRGQTAPKPA